MAKPFTWSYSRLKNFETCPKRHFEIDIAKTVQEEESEHLQWGGIVHKAAAERLGPKKTPVHNGMGDLESWCQRIEARGGKILVEQRLAITKDFGPCGYFDRDVWFRTVVDALLLAPPVALAVDWKTGKILEDSVQLALAAQCVFAHHPDVKAVRSEFVWLKEGPDVSSREDFNRDHMQNLWANLWSRIEALETAHNTLTYPPKPGRLCQKWCPVISCPNHGKRF